MADLDISELLDDPDFVDSVTVLRRTQTVGDDGRVAETTSTFEGVVMAISPTGNNDVQRLDDHQKQLRSIKVVTKFRLQGPTFGKGADLVAWQGSMYLVAVVDPYSHFGIGFIEATLVSTNIQEVPLT